MREGWNIKSLGDIATVKGGKRVPKGYKLETNPTKHPYVSVADFTDDGTVCTDGLRYISSEIYEQIKRYTISSKDLYISIAGTIGKTGSVPELLDGANLTENACKLAFNSGIDKEFVYYFTKTNSFIEQAGIHTRTSAQPKLALVRLKTISLPIPPFLEQKQIVAILDEVFAGIDDAIANTEKNLINARELFESILIAKVFQNSAQEDYWKTTVAEVALSKKGSIRTGPFGSQLLHGEFVDEGIAVLGIDNAVHNEFRWGKKRFITPDKYQQLSRYTVNPGDVLITIMGTCGRCAIVPKDIPTAINTKHLCCITLDRKKCLPSFLHAYFLYNPIAQHFLTSRAKGSIMAGLNMGLIKELPLLLPSITVQESIIKQVRFLLKEIQQLEAIYQQKNIALNELKQSILQKAFTGELTADTAAVEKERLEEVISTV